MKQRHYLKTVHAAAVFFGLSSHGAFAYAEDEKPNSTPYGVQPSIRPPFDAATFWAKLDGLIQLHGGYVEPSDVELSFGAKFDKKINIEDGGYRLEMEGDSPWFKNIDYRSDAKAYKSASQTVDAGGEQSSLEVFWGYFPGEANMCIKPNTMRDSLVSSGWRLAPREATGGEFGSYNYYKMVRPNGSSVDITYGDGTFVMDQVSPENSCVISVSISGRK
jgi:hypothetical protein